MKRYRANPVVSLREEFEGALLYNPDTDDVILINKTGRLIWDAVATPQTLEAISAYLAANTDFIAVLPNPSGGGPAASAASPSARLARIKEDITAFIGSLPSDFMVEYD